MSEPDNKTTHWWQRRSGWIVAEFDVFCVCVIIAILTVPALADIVIPIPGTTYVINLGDIPPWIGALVLAATFFEARRARKQAAAAALLLIDVKHQTDGMLATMQASAEEKGKKLAVAELATAKDVARADLVADAKASAEVKDVQGGAGT